MVGGMPETPRPVRILVGDRETQLCRLVRDVLRHAGYKPEVTQDGREILQRVPSGGYSLLILDTLLAHTTGLEVVMKLRDRGERLPIILMSSLAAEPDRVEPFAFTYRVDVLRKPFGVGDLRSAVGRSLRVQRSD